MRRRSFDQIVSWFGVLGTGALLVAGALLLWGHAFTNSNVHNELAAQKIYFPPLGSPELASNDIGPYLNRYAGQQLVDGPQAKAYADHFIAVQARDVAGGRTYSEVHAQAVANPSDTTLANEAITLFQAETSQGLLLAAYATWKVGQLALIAAIAAFGLAVVGATLAILGFRHAEKVSPHMPVFAPAAPPAAGSAPFSGGLAS